MAEEKTKSNKAKISKSSIILAVFTIVVPCILCLILLVPEMYYISRLNELIKIGAVKEATELSIIETGLSILGIAVSVWIGLNIYNVIKKSEIDKEIEEIRKTNEKIAYSYERNKFISVLEKTKNLYEISEYFIRRFEEDTTTPIEDFSIMIMFEKKFVKCCKAYEQKQKKRCKALAVELRTLLDADEIKKLKLKYDNTFKDILEMEYFFVRESDIIFYLYNSDKKSVSTDEFLYSIQIYEILIEKYRNYFEKEEKEYVYNTIAHSYFLLLNDVNNSDSELRQEWKDKARKNYEGIKNSVKGRYHQNYGCFLEKYGTSYEEAEKRYCDALRCFDVDNKNWNLLGSLYLKMFDEKVGICNRFNKKKVLSDKWKVNNSNLKLLHNAYVYLHIALSKSPELVDVYYNFAKVNLYLGLFGKKKNLKIAEEYLKIVEVSFGEDNSGYLFTLRNYYEAIGDYENAIKTNKKLINNKVNGDTRKAEGVYENRRNRCKVNREP